MTCFYKINSQLVSKILKESAPFSFLSFLHFSEAAVETNETRLYKDLFKNYNKYTHPVINESKPVTVVFDFQLIRIIDVVSTERVIYTSGAWHCLRDRFPLSVIIYSNQRSRRKTKSTLEIIIPIPLVLWKPSL